MADFVRFSGNQRIQYLLLTNLLHITLAFSLFASSVGVVINQHFCRGELKHQAVFTAVKSCHDPAEEHHKPVCPFHQQPATDSVLGQQDCCANDSQLYKTSQEQQMEVLVLSDWIPGPVYLNHLPLPGGPAIAGSPRDGDQYYRPPPLITDRSVQFQVFRL